MKKLFCLLLLILNVTGEVFSASNSFLDIKAPDLEKANASGFDKRLFQKYLFGVLSKVWGSLGYLRKKYNDNVPSEIQQLLACSVGGMCAFSGMMLSQSLADIIKDAIKTKREQIELANVVSLGDIVVTQEVRAQINDVIDEFRDNGTVSNGDPGTGKILIAKAIAKEVGCDYRVIGIGAAEVVSGLFQNSILAHRGKFEATSK